MKDEPQKGKNCLQTREDGQQTREDRQQTREDELCKLLIIRMF